MGPCGRPQMCREEGRPALALDLVEEFRPSIVDSVVVNMLNHRMLTPTDFVVELGPIVSRMSKAHESPQNPAGVWQVDAVFVV